MYKYLLTFIAALAISANIFAQNNYSGSSKFTDNVSVTLQGGTLTTFNDFYSGHTAVAPIIVIGVDKYVTPWLGFGIEGRTLIGTGSGRFNTHTAFDAINVSGNVKLNVTNLFLYDGRRRLFEPVIYTGIGWGHTNCSHVHSVYAGNGITHIDSNARNYMTYRVGTEFNFNIGKERAWAIVINPSVVWGGICNGRLHSTNGNFELTAGAVYHFKNSNGTRSFSKARLYDQDEVNALTERIKALERRRVRPRIIEKVIEKTVTVPVTTEWIVLFAFDSAELTDEAKAVLDSVAGKVSVVAYASPEGSDKYNTDLSHRRAEAVKTYLINRGITVISAEGKGVTGKASNRIAIVSLAE